MLRSLNVKSCETSCGINEDVKINGNLNVRLDPLPLSKINKKFELPEIEVPYFDTDESTYHYFIREFETLVESRLKQSGQIVLGTRMRWLGHVLRIENYRLPRKFLLSEPEIGWKR